MKPIKNLGNYLNEKNRLNQLPERNANNFIDTDLAQEKSNISNRIKRCINAHKSKTFFDPDTDWRLEMLGFTPSSKFIEFRNLDTNDNHFYPTEDIIDLKIIIEPKI